MKVSRNRPSVVWGFRRALQMWRVVVVVWLVGLAIMIPAGFVLTNATNGALQNLPGGDFQTPDGDVSILVVKAVGESAGPLTYALISAVIFAWLFTVLWHAGLARWEIWDGSGPRGLNRIFGLGLMAWWAYFRLSLTALVAFIGVGLPVLATAGVLLSASASSAAEVALVAVLAGTLAVMAILKLLVWAATLRGAWELARPAARSAATAWLRGLAGIFLRPVATVIPLVVLGLPMVLLAEAPLLLGLWIPFLRFGVLATLVGAVLTAASSLFAVALFEAFAPISEVIGPAE